MVGKVYEHFPSLMNIPNFNYLPTWKAEELWTILKYSDQTSPKCESENFPQSFYVNQVY